MDEQTLKLLIKEVEKHPCLYDTSIKEYCERYKVEVSWAKISKITGIPVQECRDKWRCLRTAFGRTVKRNSDVTCSTKRYYLHDHMMFLTPFLKQKGPQYVDTEAGNDLSDDSRSLSNDSLASEKYLTSIGAKHYEVESSGAKHYEVESSGAKHDEVELGGVKLERTEREMKRRCMDEIFVACDTTKSECHRRMFLMSILPDVNQLTDFEMTVFKRRSLQLIEDLITSRK